VSLPLWLVSVTISCGVDFLSVSAMTVVISVGSETSSCPACSAAMRVLRSPMIG